MELSAAGLSGVAILGVDLEAGDLVVPVEEAVGLVDGLEVLGGLGVLVEDLEVLVGLGVPVEDLVVLVDGLEEVMMAEHGQSNKRWGCHDYKEEFDH